MTSKNQKKYKTSIWILCISIVLVVCTSFIDGVYNSNVEYLGLPINWLALHPNNGFRFLGIGFIKE